MSDALGEATARLAQAGIETPRREARLILAYVLQVPADTLLASPAVPPNSDISLRYAALVDRRIRREPLAYIVGEKEFWSLPLRVGPGVLVPRPETETLIEQLRASVPDPNMPLSILDLGTGSACLLIAALREYPRARGVGIDSSAGALGFARSNLATHGLAARAELKEGDFSQASGRFDVILSNPPYIPSGQIASLDSDVRDYEPISALDGGPDGLAAYRLLAGLLPNLLARDGLAFLEIGQGQAQSVPGLMAATGLKVAAVTADLSGIPRCVKLQASG